VKGDKGTTLLCGERDDTMEGCRGCGRKSCSRG